MKLINTSKITHAWGNALLIGASLTALSIAQPAFAQDADAAAEAEPIVVTGIRAAIVQGLESKRASVSVLESIKAEDIGKMPDANLAEAIQRVPGVAIDRDGGEGRYVSIRGLGPQFNTVMINGRHIASSEADRSFGFDTIASDLVGGMNIYKTQEASLREGGIGGTVDVRTLHPLDRKGFNATVRAEGNYEFNSEKLTPQGSLVISDTFADDTIGVLFGASYQRRKNRVYSVSAEDGGLRTDQVWTLAGISSVPDSGSLPYWNYGNFGAPRGMIQQEPNLKQSDQDRERLGLYGDIQFKPTDDMEFNVDYLYSRFETDTRDIQVGNWFWSLMPPASSAPWIMSNLAPSDPNDPSYASWLATTNYIAQNSLAEMDANGVITRANTYPGMTTQAYNNYFSHRPTDTHMIGLNYRWDVSDKLTMTVDGAYSKAREKNPGLNGRRGFERTSTGSYTYVNDGGVPYVSGRPDDLVASMTGVTNALFFNQGEWGNDVRATNKEASINFDYEPTSNLHFSFGGLYEEAAKTRTDWATPDAQSRLYQGHFRYLTSADIAQISTGVTNWNLSNFGLPSGAGANAYFHDYDAMNAFFLNPANLNTTSLSRSQAAIDAFKAYAAAHGGNPFAAEQLGTGYSVNEKVKSLYAKGAYETDLFGVPATLLGGLRYTRTDTASTGNSRVVESIDVVPHFATYLTQVNYVGGGALQRVTEKRHYDNWLPNVMLKLEPSDSTVVRLGASKSLTRPNLEYLPPIMNSIVSGLTGGTINQNNPGLKPLVSTNVDFAGEWYFAPGSALTFDAFWKKVDGMITSQVTDGYVIPGVNLTATANGLTFPVNNFSVRTPSNAESLKVWGATVGLTHAFEFGLGAQFNYTITDSNRAMNPANYNPATITLPGLSDNFNATVFYEKGPISARVAYNWRSKFLSDGFFPAGQYGSESEPVYTRPFAQLDARLGVNVLENLQLYVDGNNLLNRVEYKQGRFDNLFIARNNYGTRVKFGAMMKF